MSWEVLDISKYQSNITYKSVAGSVDGVIIRLGYRGYSSSGTLVTDTKFETHYKGLKGKTKLGYYWFSTAITEAEAIAEANYCHKLLSGKQNDMPVYFDSEYSNSSHNGRSDNLSKANRTKYCIAWCKRMIELGYRAGVYASDSWFNSNLDLSKLYSGGYSLWVAKYSKDKPKYVSKYDAWQYTSSGKVDGYSGNVDLSHFYTDVAGWSGSPTPTPTEKPIVANPTLKSGDKGTQVTYLQQDLNYINNAGLTVDGIFGTNTFNAVKAFQSKYGLTVDGIYGTQSYNKMNELINGVTPSPDPEPEPEAIDINTLTITINPTEVTYYGEVNCPAVGISGLSMGIDYTVEYSNNTNAGTGTITIKGIGAYTGTATKTFTINPQQLGLNGRSIIVNPSSYEYIGSAITPNFAIYGLTLNVDYVVSISNNVNVGTGNITATGIGNYTGSIYGTFTIANKDISGMSGSLSGTSFEYTGSAITPTMTINGLINGTDFDVTYSNNINIGIGYAIATGKGNYSGTLMLPFEITQKPLYGNISLNPSSFVYDGNYCVPEVTISGLVQNTDYVIEITNNLNAGTATVTATGIGNYIGSINTTFRIEPKPITDFEMPTIEPMYYCNSWLEPEIIIEGLTEGLDYALNYRNNFNIGTDAEVIVSGIGNYGSSATIPFEIVNTPISKCVVKLGTASIYTIYRIYGPLVITYGDYTLRESIDYQVLSTKVEGKQDYTLYTLEIEGIGGFDESGTYRFRCIPYEPTDIDTTDDGVYFFEDIDTGEESAVGNYDFYDIDPNENYYPSSVDPNDVLTASLEEDIDGGDITEDEPSVVIDGYDYDFEAFSNIYLDEYDIDDGTNIDKDGERKEDEDPEEDEDLDDGVYNFGDIDEGDETAEGDYDFGDLDEGVDKDSVADGDYDFNVESEGFPAGTEVQLDNTPVYANYCSTVSTTTKSGVYFIYKSQVVNDKIRITKTEAGVENPARCAGWVKIDDLYNLGQPKLKEPFIVSGRLMRYTNGQDSNLYVDIYNQLMYVVQISDPDTYPYPYGMAYGPTDTRIGWCNTDIMTKIEEE